MSRARREHLDPRELNSHLRARLDPLVHREATAVMAVMAEPSPVMVEPAATAAQVAQVVPAEMGLQRPAVLPVMVAQAVMAVSAAMAAPADQRCAPAMPVRGAMEVTVASPALAVTVDQRPPEPRAMVARAAMAVTVDSRVQVEAARQLVLSVETVAMEPQRAPVAMEEAPVRVDRMAVVVPAVSGAPVVTAARADRPWRRFQ